MSRRMRLLLGTLVGLALVLVVGLMPGMSLTAYAAEATETIATATIMQEEYTGSHFKIKGICWDAEDPKGLFICPAYPGRGLPKCDVTISSLQGETIKSIQGVVGSTTNLGNFNLKTTQGSLSLSGETLSINDTNAGSVTISNEGTGETILQIKQWTITYEDVAVTGVTLNPSSATLTAGGDPVALTATVEPADATDKTVNWSVGGTGASAVTLYSDATCDTPVELGTPTEALTVYAKGSSADEATVTCASNANSTKSARCGVTVNKFDPTANAPTGLTATYGQTLADVSLEGKNPEGNTEGTWAWDDAAQSVGDVVSPAATFPATFTPADVAKYNTVSVPVAVTVDK